MIRRSKPNAGRKPRVRPTLSRASWAVEDRLVWGGADLLRSVFEIVRWPFERIAWAVERAAIWPLQKRTAGWSDGLRAGGGAALGLIAIGACVLGAVLAAGGGSDNATVVEARHAAPLPVAAAPSTSHEKTTPAEPSLHGAPPDFTPQDKVGAGKALAAAPPAANEGKAPGAESGTAGGAVATSSSSATAGADAKVIAVGPTATKVAHRFAGAFVHFETGQVDQGVRSAFAATATPELARSLLHRPPRLPANVHVPRAKVLNIVPGPKHGDAYTLSVSLLRVGITSELRIEMERDPTSHEWQVTDMLG
jgi:hypothetical protein